MGKKKPTTGRAKPTERRAPVATVGIAGLGVASFGVSQVPNAWDTGWRVAPPLPSFPPFRHPSLTGYSESWTAQPGGIDSGLG